jgi:cysteine desulfurase
VLNACRKLETEGIEVTYLPVDRVGHISIADIESAIKPNTKLVSIMLANNEIGTIQSISDISKILRTRKILFHTDAVQAVGHIPVNVSELGVDFLTASAHKFNGAKGTGILYIRSGNKLPQMVFGGKQEYGRRSGTENVAGIVAAGYAIEESISDIDNKVAALQSFEALTRKRIQSKILKKTAKRISFYCLCSP